MIRYNLGIIAEYLVMIYYILGMHRVLHHRYKTKVGEIDLIFLKNNRLIFVEVKARKNGMHENIVSQVQQQRITRTAELFITKNFKYADCELRFDLAIVVPYRLPQIIKNAW